MNKLIEAIETIQDMLDVSERTGSAYVYTHNGGNERIRNVLEQLQTYKELREKNTKLLRSLWRKDGFGGGLTMKAFFENDKNILVFRDIKKIGKSKTNEEWLKSLNTEELAKELALIAEWDRTQVEKTRKSVGLQEFMERWLKSKHREK